MLKWILLIALVFVVFYVIKSFKVSVTKPLPIKTIEQVNQIHETKIKEPTKDIKEDVNKVYYQALLKLAKKHKHDDDDVYLLNKVISDEEVTRPIYVLAHNLYTSILADEAPVKKTVMFRDDPQNVHDSVLNAELDKHIKGLLEEPFDGKEIPDYLKVLSDLNDAKTNAFLKGTLDTTYKGGLERDIYKSVWRRCCEYGKVGQEAFIDAVKDCVRDDMYLHCTTGRVARITSSLAGLDKEYGLLKNTDVLRQEALEKCSFIYSELSKGGGEVDNEVLKKRIEETLRMDYSHVNATVLDDIIKSCTDIEA